MPILGRGPSDAEFEALKMRVETLEKCVEESEERVPEWFKKQLREAMEDADSGDIA